MRSKRYKRIKENALSTLSLPKKIHAFKHVSFLKKESNIMIHAQLRQSYNAYLQAIQFLTFCLSAKSEKKYYLTDKKGLVYLDRFCIARAIDNLIDSHYEEKLNKGIAFDKINILHCVYNMLTMIPMKNIFNLQALCCVKNQNYYIVDNNFYNDFKLYPICKQALLSNNNFNFITNFLRSTFDKSGDTKV